MQIPTESDLYASVVSAFVVLTRQRESYVVARSQLIARSIITFATRNDNSAATVPAISRDKPAPMLFAKCRLPDAIIHERSRGAPELKRASNAPAKFNNKIAGTLISLARVNLAVISFEHVLDIVEITLRGLPLAYVYRRALEISGIVIIIIFFFQLVSSRMKKYSSLPPLQCVNYANRNCVYART